MPAPSAAPAPGPQTPFEIGLVMAGAISAGAYTAGVIDFLVEALDAWEEAKKQARQDLAAGKPIDCPMHEVKLRVMAGASAGGMTSGLAAGLLGMDYESVLAQPTNGQMATPNNNNLYRSWVNTIDISPLLGHKDLDAPGALPVQSVLDSSILLDIANNAFKFESPDERKARPYVADPLHVILTVTNLRGVPYAIDFMNFKKTQQYEMMMHADNMHFIVSQSDPGHPGAFWLKPYQFNAPEWQTLEHSSLATGAFPFGLAPRLLARPPAQYQAREWAISTAVVIDGAEYYVESWKAIGPTWPAIDATSQNDPAFQYQFLCVDGGVMNNEPLDLARRVLAGPTGDNPREGDKAVRAVLMIMPFPNATPFDVQYPGQTNLFGLLFNTFNSLIAQARFNPQELALADNPDVYSRFLIIPRRGFENGKPRTNTIACGSLQGFGGFLSRQFREHDYQLGRRNCQWFLRHYFVLPSEDTPKQARNKLFDDWTPEAREKHAVHRAGWGADGAHKPAAGAQGEVLPFLPIIPLCGQAAVSIPETTWPTFTEDEFQALQPKIQDRLNRVVDALIDQNVSGFFSRHGLKMVWCYQSGNALTSIMNAIRANLTTMGLMKKP